MTLKEARTDATTKANLLKVNHVIVQVAHKHRVYTEKQYPNGYLELVKPIEETIENKEVVEAKKAKTKSNAISEA